MQVLCIFRFKIFMTMCILFILVASGAHTVVYFTKNVHLGVPKQIVYLMTELN